jgi:hypothetical protein
MLSYKRMRLNVGTGYPCLIFMKLSFSRQIFEKYSNINSHKNPSSGSRVVHVGGRTGTRMGRTFMLFISVYSYN